MFILMVLFATAGFALLLAAPVIARVIVGSRGDPTAVARVLRGLAVILLIVALFVRPYNPSTAAIPPSPNLPAAKPE